MDILVVMPLSEELGHVHRFLEPLHLTPLEGVFRSYQTSFTNAFYLLSVGLESQGAIAGHHGTNHGHGHNTHSKATTTHHPNGAVTHSTTTGIPHVPIGQKISGKMDVLVGEVSSDFPVESAAQLRSSSSRNSTSILKYPRPDFSFYRHL